MYRTKGDFVQIQIHNRLISNDSLDNKYFQGYYEAFIAAHEDVSLNVGMSDNEGYKRGTLTISGWRNCTQEELVQKKKLEVIRAEQKEQSEKNQFLMLKAKHPEWI